MAPEQIADIPDVVSVPGVPIRERVVVRKRRSRKAHAAASGQRRSAPQSPSQFPAVHGRV